MFGLQLMELVYNVNQLFPEAQYVAPECLILSTTQRYEFTLNMQIEEVGSLFSPEKIIKLITQ